MRILLAEDEKSLSSALVTILKYNNFSVDACFDGLEALSFLDVNNYDLVILDNVWGFNDVDMNVCWTYISYLRKKLILLNAHVKIKAIRNIGYTLEKLDA